MVFHDFEAHGAPRTKKTGQRAIGEKWTALPTGAVDQSRVRQASTPFTLRPVRPVVRARSAPEPG